MVDLHEEDPPIEDWIIVECPHCDHEFKTHGYGDLCGCENCGESFRRFQNYVREA